VLAGLAVAQAGQLLFQRGDFELSMSPVSVCGADGIPRAEYHSAQPGGARQFSSVAAVRGRASPSLHRLPIGARVTNPPHNPAKGSEGQRADHFIHLVLAARSSLATPRGAKLAA